MEATERVDKLGVYFVYHNIREKYNLTFEKFVEMVDNDTWKYVVGTN